MDYEIEQPSNWQVQRDDQIGVHTVVCMSDEGNNERNYTLPGRVMLIRMTNFY